MFAQGIFPRNIHYAEAAASGSDSAGTWTSAGSVSLFTHEPGDVMVGLKGEPAPTFTNGLRVLNQWGASGQTVEMHMRIDQSGGVGTIWQAVWAASLNVSGSLGDYARHLPPGDMVMARGLSATSTSWTLYIKVGFDGTLPCQCNVQECLIYAYHLGNTTFTA